MKVILEILVTVTQSVTNVPQMNNTSTSGMNEEQCENIARNNQSPDFDSIMTLSQKVVIHLCVKLSVFAVSMAMAGILKFPRLKTTYTHAIQHFN